MRHVRFVVGLMVGAILGLACSADAASTKTDFTSTNGSLSGGQVEMRGFHYNCITYTTAERGGLWCDRIGAP